MTNDGINKMNEFFKEQRETDEKFEKELDIKVDSKTIWNPLSMCKESSVSDKIDIKSPPCGASCKNWNPMSKYGYDNLLRKNVITGTILCHAKMQQDFSCFEATEELLKKKKDSMIAKDSFDKYINYASQLNEKIEELDNPQPHKYVCDPDVEIDDQALKEIILSAGIDDYSDNKEKEKMTFF